MERDPEGIGPGLKRLDLLPRVIGSHEGFKAGEMHIRIAWWTKSLTVPGLMAWRGKSGARRPARRLQQARNNGT